MLLACRRSLKRRRSEGAEFLLSDQTHFSKAPMIELPYGRHSKPNECEPRNHGNGNDNPKLGSAT
jgi:hypothetical protein